MASELPLPPLELRELVGPTDPALFDNPTRAPVFEGLPPQAWRTYLDFGCGCGRSARRIMQQQPRPERYIGVDLHRGMVQWCQENLAPRAEGFEFIHHDVYSPCLNPDPLRPWVQPLPVEDGSVTLMEATSVFTHLIEGQAEFYLDEVQRVLAADGRLVSTWFLFDKAGFPYMQDNQNALYINDRDPTNAVVYDRAWLGAALASRGLVIAGVYPPSVRGFHWTLHIVRDGPGVQAVEIPPDSAPAGRRAPPLLREGADRFGLDGAPVSLAVPKAPRSEPPPPSPLAIELQAAKLQIASLQAQVSALRGELEARSPRRARRAGRTRRA